jgi:hypothetical protein
MVLFCLALFSAFANFSPATAIDSGHCIIHADSLPDKKAEEIQQLIDKARPGDTVFLEEGVYKLSDRPIQPVVSGRKDAWITIIPSGGKRVIIDGSDYLSSYDTTKRLPQTGSITFTNCRYIRMEGIETRQSHNAGIIIQGASTDHIEIIDCKSTGSYNSGISIWYADSCKILHCEVIGANNQALRPRGVPLRGEAPHEAISLAGASHFEVAFNLVHDCFKEGIDCKEVSNHGVIHHNTVYSMPRQGLYTDCWFGRLSNVEFHHNIVHHCEWGFGISGEGKNASMDSVFFHHNLLYDNRASGIFFSVWGSDEQRENIFIYNNTLFNNGTAGHWSGLTGGIDLMSSNLKNVFIYNNIISKNYGYAIGAFADNSEKDAAFKDRNIKILHNLEWQVNIPGKESPRPNFRPIYPIEGGSAIKADPQFTDAVGGDFSLSGSSPAFDKGWRDAPSGKTNYLGAISPYK